MGLELSGFVRGLELGVQGLGFKFVTDPSPRWELPKIGDPDIEPEIVGSL